MNYGAKQGECADNTRENRILQNGKTKYCNNIMEYCNNNIK